MTAISTLRPGLLVSLNTDLKGNAKYFRRDIEVDHLNEYGERVAKWETERLIVDPAEHADAIKARSDARNIITRVCTQSKFGLFCLTSRRDELQEAISTARSIVNGFNSRAAVTEVGLYIVIGQIAQDDVEAVRAINSEVRGLIETMERGVRACDPKVIREAANKAKQLGQMLTPEANARVESALVQARAAARRIVQAGETAAREVDQGVLEGLAAARTAFLDIDEPAEAPAPFTFEQAARAIDLEPAPELVTAAPAPGPGYFDLEPAPSVNVTPKAASLMFDF